MISLIANLCQTLIGRYSIAFVPNNFRKITFGTLVDDFGKEKMAVVLGVFFS